MNKEYAQTVQLLLAVAPDVFHTPVFAMKGGTAINLFVQDMPRLSTSIWIGLRAGGLCSQPTGARTVHA
jgi:hypothetical protein